MSKGIIKSQGQHLTEVDPAAICLLSFIKKPHMHSHKSEVWNKISHTLKKNRQQVKGFYLEQSKTDLAIFQMCMILP